MAQKKGKKKKNSPVKTTVEIKGKKFELPLKQKLVSIDVQYVPGKK